MRLVLGIRIVGTNSTTEYLSWSQAFVYLCMDPEPDFRLRVFAWISPFISLNPHRTPYLICCHNTNWAVKSPQESALDAVKSLLYSICRFFLLRLEAIGKQLLLIFISWATAYQFGCCHFLLRSLLLLPLSQPFHCSPPPQESGGEDTVSLISQWLWGNL